jgi:hypothetical protein
MKTIQLLAIGAAMGALVLSPHAFGQDRFATLYNVTGDNPIGLAAINGAIYVTTFSNSVNGNCGTVLELQAPSTGGTAWTETVLYSFAGGEDACSPVAAPFVGADGVLYGIASGGGAYNWGALYELQPPTSPDGAWTEAVLYSFSAPGANTGSSANNLLPGPGGSFYLVTADSGAFGAGALVELKPPPVPGGGWTSTVLYSLPAEGGEPTSLTMGADGVFYGTTLYGGTAPGELGEVFQLTRPAAPGGAWTETVLHNFGYGDGSASSPNSLTVAGDGTVYGTSSGPTFFTNGAGTVFKLAPPSSPGGSWAYTVLKNFGEGGVAPDSPLILRNGNLYGAITSPAGGVLFELQPPATPGGAWTTTYLHNFRNGQMPGGAMVMDSDGTIYGVTVAPRAQQPGGTVFRITSK